MIGSQCQEITQHLLLSEGPFPSAPTYPVPLRWMEFFLLSPFISASTSPLAPFSCVPSAPPSGVFSCMAASPAGGATLLAIATAWSSDRRRGFWLLPSRASARLSG